MPQQLAVKREAVRVVVVAGHEKIPPAALLRGDDFLQVRIAEHSIADEVNGADAGYGSFEDFINKIDSILVEIDALGLNPGGKASLPAIEVDDAPGVRLHLCAVEGGALAQERFRAQGFVVDDVVALESDAIDNRILLHHNDEARAFLGDLHI